MYFRLSQSKNTTMKKLLLFAILAALLIPVSVFSQEESDSTGFAGDHFSLEGALELFKQSKSPEEYEKKLNTEDNYVNNLDLNEDGQIDYIRVLDNKEGEVHAMVLQVDINGEESQDIAVILIEKTGPENAVLQIIGDEDVYGEEKIVEPYAESMEAGGKGMALENFGAARIVVNVWVWPGVRFIYGPTYVVYRSPWRWMNYPGWWTPWRPHPWRWHHSRTVVYHTHYRPFHTHRVVKAHSFYKPKRKSSVTVRTKTVHTRTVVKKGTNGPEVKRTKVEKTTRVSKKGREGKIEKRTATKQSRTSVSGNKESGIRKKKTTRKKVRSN
jgi:hypothetical protein